MPQISKSARQLGGTVEERSPILRVPCHPSHRKPNQINNILLPFFGITRKTSQILSFSRTRPRFFRNTSATLLPGAPIRGTTLTLSAPCWSGTFLLNGDDAAETKRLKNTTKDNKTQHS